ncbi:hypothetical protein [Aquimonas sp.]|jgi:hypothetical protein|uniref:hypothetical protein n=1 Tax=Aquimonas sp. TaxID=1872588 RepID=UPI0037BF5106
MRILVSGLLLTQVALGLVVIVSAFLAVFNVQIDPSSGPVGAFLAALPVWPLILGSLAVSLALRWVRGHLEAERQ